MANFCCIILHRLSRSHETDPKQAMFPSRAKRILKDRSNEEWKENSLHVFLLLSLFPFLFFSFDKRMIFSEQIRFPVDLRLKTNNAFN